MVRVRAGRLLAADGRPQGKGKACETAARFHKRAQLHKTRLLTAECVLCVRRASNPLVAELLKQGKLLASSRTGDEPSQPQRSAQGDASSSEETEAGEIRDEAAPESRDDRDAPARKRKHSPIVWNPGPAKSAKATEDSQPLSILERTQKEAAALKEMQRAMEEDIDPDAPALMKGSPVLSDEGKRVCVCVSCVSCIVGQERTG